MKSDTHQFDFSVVMAVYNVEKYLGEAIESLVTQSYGFENIQLVLVDDGSTDGSPAICDEYATRYPANVVALHKANGGVSSARNLGIQHATGTYVNFMDSDDKFANNVIASVAKFFNRFGGAVDVVSIPMFFFDGQTGPHVLNKKFSKGTRVINLRSEPDAIQLSTSSAFIRRSAIEEDHVFDEQLMFCEDAKFLVPILCRTMRMGVVSTCKYLYRKRQAGNSASQQSFRRSEWWTPTIDRFYGGTIDYCRQRCGFIPSFAQYLLAYDLQWRAGIEAFPPEVLTDEEQREYLGRLRDVLQYIDDEVIFKQANVFSEEKKFLLELKHGRDYFTLSEDKTCIIHENMLIGQIDANRSQIDFLTCVGQDLHIEGFHGLLAHDYGEVVPACKVDGAVVECRRVERDRAKTALGTTISEAIGFSIDVPMPLTQGEQTEVQLGLLIDGVWVGRKNIAFGKYTLMPREVGTEWPCGKTHTVVFDGACLRIGAVQDSAFCGRALLKRLSKVHKPFALKAIVARLVYAALEKAKRKPVWLVCDRVDKAGDNGEAFFAYLCAERGAEVAPYFLIDKNSPDFARLKAKYHGKIVPMGSWHHKQLFLLADQLCSSQADDQMLRPFREYTYLYQDLVYNKRFAFLQHGVTQNDVTKLLNRYNKNISTFVTTTQPEYDSILSSAYHYDEGQVKLTGFPRFDLLENHAERIVTIMPTWRASLVGDYDEKLACRRLKPGFEKSKFYGMYHALLSSEALFDYAQEHGVTIQLMMHPNMAQALDCLAPDKRLVICSPTKPYREIFAESALVVTDYSSVAFDFAYLRKPVLYLQGDYDEFFSGSHTLLRGYFDYRRDGFGEVATTVEEMVALLESYINSQFSLKDEYRARIDSTFPFSDRRNSERVFAAICDRDVSGDGDPHYAVAGGRSA